MKILLIDIGSELAEAAEACAWPADPDVEVRRFSSVADVPAVHGVAYVAPLNSMGFMDGGVDAVYSRVMFPGLEADIKAAIKERGFLSTLGRPYLPIGHTVSVPVSGGAHVIGAPTMLLPQEVINTRNAFLAMNAALWEADRLGVDTLVVTGMCTGYGKMPPDRAIGQMKAAHEAYKKGVRHGIPVDVVLREQPRVYMNTEWDLGELA